MVFNASGLFSFRFFSLTGWGINLNYCDIDWFALEMNRDHSVIFDIALKCCISDSFVDYEGYSISSKGILVQGLVIKTILKKKKCKKAKWLSEKVKVKVA